MFQCALWLNRSRRSTSALVSVSSRRTSCSRRPFIGSFSSSSRSSRVTSQSLYRSSAFHSHSILSNNGKSRNLASFSSSSSAASAASAASSTPHPHALRLLLEDYQTLQCPYTPEEEPRDLWNARRKKLRKKLGLYRLLRDEELRELVAGLRDPVEEGLESALERAAAVAGGNEDQEAAAASRVGEKEFVLFPGAGSWNITPIKGGRQSNLDANFQSARTSHEVTSSTHSSESLSSSPSSTTTTPSAPPPAPAPAQTKSRRPTSDLEAEGYALQKVFEMKDWMAGIEFLNRASEIIEDQDVSSLAIFFSSPSNETIGVHFLCIPPLPVSSPVRPEESWRLTFFLLPLSFFFFHSLGRATHSTTLPYT